MFNWIIFLLNVDYGELRELSVEFYAEMFQWKHLPVHMIYFTTMFVFGRIMYKILLPQWMWLYRSLFENDFEIPEEEAESWSEVYTEMGPGKAVSVVIGNTTYYKVIDEIPKAPHESKKDK